MKNNKGRIKLNILIKILVFALIMGACVPLFLCKNLDANTAEYIASISPKSEEYATTKKIKVGYFTAGEYFKKNRNGNIVSYDTEYLSKISKYSDFRFVFVDCGSWNNALKMLKEHKIDLLGTAQWTQKREELFDFSDQYGLTYSSIVALNSSNIVFDDSKALNNKKIGCVKTYPRKVDFLNYIEDNKINPKIIYYKRIEQMEKALEKGEIDAAVSSVHCKKSNYKLIANLGYNPYYFITWEENYKLIDKLDSVMTKISMKEPIFQSNLRNTYFPTINEMPFTKKELDYIKNSKAIEMVYEDNTEPLAWKNDKGQVTGMLVDVLKEVEKKSGLTFKYVESKEADRNKNKTVSFYLSKDTGYVESEATDFYFMECPFVIYHLKSQGYTSNGKYKIAIPKYRPKLREELYNRYNECSIYEYDNVYDCFDALENKKVDLVVANYYVGENDILASGLSEIEKIPSGEMNYYFYLKVKDATLRSILNKSISMLNKDEINNLQLKYALKVQPKYSFSYIVENYTDVVIVTAIIIMLVILLTGALIARMLLMKKAQEELKKINEQLESATNAKNDFLSRISHDMRTPMNGIIGITSLTLDIPNLTEEVKNNLETINDSGHYLMNLINDTLDMNKIESNKIELNYEVASTKDLVNRIISVVNQSAKAKDISIEVIKIDTDLPYIRVDKIRIQQIFTNLLSNAIKFTPEGGKIVWTIKRVGKTENISHVMISLKDNGVGMSEDFQKHLFEPFAQENNSESNKYTGTGLGLSIVKNLTEMMGGELTVKSKLNEGTEFVLKLDLEIVPDYKEEKLVGNEENIALEGKKVLLCEDHALNAKITTKVLEKVGIKVQWAKNGEEGVKMFKSFDENYFDAILMDVRMPVMDGVEATKEIRSCDREDGKTIPIIALTANAYSEDRKKNLEAGMNEHLSKPIDPMELYSTLKRYCDK